MHDDEADELWQRLLPHAAQGTQSMARRKRIPDYLSKQSAREMRLPGLTQASFRNHCAEVTEALLKNEGSGRKEG